MSDPKRLLDASPNPLTRQLLESGLPDNPPPEALQRTAAAFGLGTIATTATSGVFASGTAAEVASGTVAAGAAKGSALLGAGAAKSLLPVALKWLGIGLVSGGLAAGAVQSFGAHPARAPKAASQPKLPANPAPVAAHVAQAPKASQSAETNVREELPPPKVPLRAAAPTAARNQPDEPALEPSIAESTPSAPSDEHRASFDEITEPKASPPTSQSDIAGTFGVPNSAAPNISQDNVELRREVSLIDAAKRSLAHGNASEALRWLDEYAKQRRLGILDREALVLRIDTLLLRGDVRSARELAARYLALYPKDAHAARLQALVQAGQSSGNPKP